MENLTRPFEVFSTTTQNDHHYQEHNNQSLATSFTNGSSSSINLDNNLNTGSNQQLESPKVNRLIARLSDTPLPKLSRTPFQNLLLDLHNFLRKRDKRNFFKQPVSDSIAPNYSIIIKRPMDLGTIRKRILENRYQTLGDFKEDVRQMFDNAMIYNFPETIYHKEASKLWDYAKSVFRKELMIKFSRSHPGLVWQLSFDLSAEFEATPPKSEDRQRGVIVEKSEDYFDFVLNATKRQSNESKEPEVQSLNLVNSSPVKRVNFSNDHPIGQTTPSKSIKPEVSPTPAANLQRPFEVFSSTSSSYNLFTSPDRESSSNFTAELTGSDHFKIKIKRKLFEPVVSPIVKSEPISTPTKVVKKPNRKPPKTPMQTLLLSIHRLLKQRDLSNFFGHPVSDVIAPNYSKIIARPLDLETIRKSINKHRYQTLGDFREDIRQMLENAMVYNRPETVYHKTASKMWDYAKSRLFGKDSVVGYSMKHPQLTWQLSLNLSPTFEATLPRKEQRQRASTHENVDSVDHENPGYPEIDAQIVWDNRCSQIEPEIQHFPVNYAEPEPMMKDESFDHRSYFSPATSFSFSNPIDSSAFSISNGQTSTTMNWMTNNSGFSAKQEEPEEEKEELFDGMTADQLIQSVQASARMARERLQRKGPPAKLSYLAQLGDGSLVIRPLDPAEPEVPFDPKLIYNISLSHNQQEELPTLKIPDNFTTSREFPQPKRFKAEIETSVCPIPGHSKKPEVANKQPNCDDSDNDQEDDDDDADEVSNLDSEYRKLLPVYGTRTGLEYAQSVMRFASGQDYTLRLVNTLLNVLTSGGHRDVEGKFLELIQQEIQQNEWIN